MSRWRRPLLLIAPLPILSASWGLTHWTRGDSVMDPTPNRVQLVSAHLPVDDHAGGDYELRMACERQADAWRRQLGSQATVIVRPPFVLTGNLPSPELARWHDETIRPAARALAASYFTQLPHEPISVLLFNDAANYTHYARELFGDEAVSRYGYYRPHGRTLVLDVSTGGGTLLHELTHALAAFDFPGMPDWFNEGLASLHEACQLSPDGRELRGTVNWRLPGLQRVARGGALPRLSQWLESTSFRGSDEGLHYALARYLCLYLQERGALEAFYREFRDRREDDPRGLATLCVVLNTDAQQLETDLTAWIVSLPTP